MKESMRKNWKPITAMACCFVAVGVAAYYVNYIYLPGKQRAATAEIAVTEPAVPKAYNYTISKANAEAAATSSTSDTHSDSKNPANDRINVTTEANGDVTIKRTWDAKPGELDTTTTAPNAPTANIGSGGEKITGADGAYHGEQPVVTTPDTKSPKPESKPTTPPPAEKPSKPSEPSSSTPKDGDHRVVDGKEQEYWEGFGWVDKGDGGHTDYIEMGPDEALGEICENASFG